VAIAGILILVGALLVLADPVDAEQYGVSLGFETPGNERAFIPPTPVVFNMTIEHTGDQLIQSVVVEILVEPAGWTHNLIAETDHGTKVSPDELTIILDVGEVAALSVTIMPASGMANRTYWLTVWAYAKDEISADDSRDLGVVITRAVDYGLVLWNKPPDGVYKAIPSTTVTMRYAVYNLGNSDDSFLIRATSSLSEAGWVPMFASGVDGLGWTPYLPPDPGRENPHFMDVKVPVPEGEVAGTTCYVSINASSKLDPSLERMPASGTIRVLQTYGFSVDIQGPDQKKGSVGGSVDFLLVIKNTGNGADTFRIFAAWDEVEAPGWFAKADPSEIIIQAGTNDTTDYIVKLPDNATLGTYTFHAEIWSSSLELKSISKTFKVTVADHYEMVVWADEEATSGPGERVVLDVHVRNVGNAVDSYNFTLMDAPQDWVYFLQPTSLTLFTDETGQMNVTMLIPDDLGDSPSATYVFDLLVGSVKGDAEETVTLSVHMRPFGRVEWMWDDQVVTSPGAPNASVGTLRPKSVIDVYNGTTAAFSLFLRNSGIIDDNVTLWAMSDDDRITVTVLPDWYIVIPLMDLEVFVQISVPDNMFPGEHRVWIKASSSDARQDTRAVPIEFDVIPYYDTIDFADMRWDDLLADDFSYTYSMEGNEVVNARGRRGQYDEFDVVSLTGLLDLETNTVTVTMELKGSPVQGSGVFYAVYFVNADHQVIGGLVDPGSHRRGDFVWESHDDANTRAFMYLSDNQMGSSVPMLSLQVEFESDRVVYTFHARDLRKAGVDPGSDFRLYAYCHRLGSPGGGDEETQLIYDTAGVGAIDAPREFTREPAEPSSFLWVGVGLAIVIALAVLFVVFLPKLLPHEPEPEPTEEDEWVEYQ